jgi:hypothetical protein
MSIYSGNNYRKIYEQHHGPIPFDSEGRRYDIHHIDGNRQNNSPSNLIAVSIQDHYNIHYAQGDYSACLIMAKRANITTKEKSMLAKKSARRLVESGKHHLLSGEIQRRSALERAQKGMLPGQGPKNPFWGGEIQRKSAANLLANGRHHSQQKWECPHCKTQGQGKAVYHNWHGDNCGMINEANAVYVNNVRYATKKQACLALNITMYELYKRMSHK